MKEYMANKEIGIEAKPLPEEKKPRKKVLPKTGNPENTVQIGNTLVEIKPTKLKYHRNNTAYFYRFVENVPLPDIMAMKAGSFGDDRDGDKALMDWLICVVDDVDLIVDNYDEMDTETIEKILSIFKRVNKIEEKEARQKNVESQVKKA